MYSSTNILSKSTLCSITDFLLNEEDIPETVKENYEARIKKAEKPLFAKLHGDYPEMLEYDKVDSLMHHALAVYQEVYLELGIKIGANLQRQLMV